MKKCTICGNPDVYNIAFNRDKSDYSIKPNHYQMVHKLSDGELPEELHGYYCNMCKKLVDVTNMERKTRGHEPLIHN